VLLPSNFQFSQSNLQDFSDCPRRFQLKYINQLSWPAVEAEPALKNERLLILGNNFHKLAQQHFLGVPKEDLNAIAGKNEHLSKWLEHFLIYQSQITHKSTQLFPEISLSAPIADYRLFAKFDLLSVDPENHLIIYDWKTSRNLPKRAWLQNRLQTHVYPYILFRSANSIPLLDEVSPDKINMVYWFSNHPSEPVHFRYDTKQFKRDDSFLTKLVKQVEALHSEDAAALTADLKLCEYCVYRSLCNRGIEAGSSDEMDLPDDYEIGIDFNFEQIAEIEF